MPESSAKKKTTAQSTFIFKGTVSKVGAVTMKAIPVTKNTVVVGVDEVVEAPASLEDYKGQKITVELLQGKKVKVGEQYLFYSNGWVFGEGLAVQSIAHEIAAKPAAARATVRAAETRPVARGATPSAKLHKKLARARFEAADMVVTGRVASVRVPRERVMMAASLEGSLQKPVSEHDPVTQEAVIQITSVHKGAPGASEVTLRFPSSTDVRWYQSPKFHPGQEGLFMLHKEETPRKSAVRGAAIAAALPADDSAGFHTALHPADFQSMNEAAGGQTIDDLFSTAVSSEAVEATEPPEENK
jgi:hypothetical protein